MNKKQLWRELAGVPDDAELVMASDAEGNEFRPLAALGTGSYVGRGKYRGGDFFNDDEEGGEGVPAVCLWPEG
jgi:hypothetical protein